MTHGNNNGGNDNGNEPMDHGPTSEHPSRAFDYKQMDDGTWSCYVGASLIATAPTQGALQQLVAERHR